MRTWAADRSGRPAPATALFLAAGVSQYAGAALAVTLFVSLAPVTVAWLRIVVTAVVLVAWWRPWRVVWTRQALAGAAVTGLLLALMAVSFYEAIARIPIATAVAVQFTGPVAVAVWRRRTFGTRLGALLAVGGLLALATLGQDWSTSPQATRTGLLAAAGAAATWAAMLVLGGRIRGPGDATAAVSVGTAAAALVLAPVAASGAGPVLQDPRLALAVLGVGLASGVLPSALDRVTLRRLGPRSFALLNALLPVTAAVVGRIGAGQRLSAGELLGVVLVSLAVAMTTTALRAARR